MQIAREGGQRARPPSLALALAQLLLKCYLVMLILTAVSTMCFYGYAVRTHLYYDGLGWCKSSRDKN